MDNHLTPRHEMPASGGSPGGTSPRRRILVVDDDMDILRLNLEALSDSGYHVDAVKDGEAAWESLQTNSYDLMVTDNNMPKVTGLELVKKLRAARMALPIIMATGCPPEGFHHPSLQPAVALLKPYTIPELLGTVENVLRATAIAPEPIASPDSQNNAPSHGWGL